MRFVAMQEPPHDSWAVFDTGNGVPAEYAGRLLIGLTSREAHCFAAVANDYPSWPQHGRSVGQADLSRLAAGGALQDRKRPAWRVFKGTCCRNDSSSAPLR